MREVRAFAVALTVSLLCVVPYIAHANSFTGSANPKAMIAGSHMAGHRLAFVPNKGQWDSRALYRAQGGSATAWFVSGGVRYEFKHTKLKKTSHIESLSRSNSQLPVIEVAGAHFVGANQSAAIVGERTIDYTTNYFIGRDSSRWQTCVPAFEQITYQEIYPGIDIKYYATNDHLEYDLIVSPLGQLSNVEIAYDGITGLEISPSGKLVAQLKGGRVVEHEPYVYYLSNGVKHPLPARFVLLSPTSFGFELLAPRPAEFALVVDPAVTFGTDFGGNDDEDCMGIAVDGSGAIYICGYTPSTQFPLVNAPDNTNQMVAGEAFVAKIMPGNTTPIFSTFLGGSKGELCWDIALDASNNPIVVGQTFSPDFPLAGTPIKSVLGNLDQDAFVTKIGTNGTTLIFSTLLGGSGFDQAFGVAVNSTGEPWIVGSTSASDFPRKKSPLSNTIIDSTYAAVEGFATRISSNGSALVYSTLVGGSLADEIDEVMIDKLGNIHLAGVTYSSNFPTLAAYDATLGGPSDYVVMELSPTDVLLYSTLLGGSNGESTILGGNTGIGLWADSTGATYFAGASSSADYPLLNPYSSLNSPNYSGVISKLAPNGSSLVFSTRLGSHYTWLHGIATDDSCRVYVVGESRENYPTSYYANDAVYGVSPWLDAVFSVLSADGQFLLYSTYLGGQYADAAYDIRVLPGYQAYLAGSTYNEIGWPLVNRLDTAYEWPTGVGVDDAAIAVFNNPVDYVPTNTAAGNNVNVPLPFGWFAYFRHTTDTGTTKIIKSTTGPAAPANFAMMPTSPTTYYNITTTATFTDSVIICCLYDQSQVVGNEADLKMYHYSGGSWQDVTRFLDVSTNQICGVVYSFSPFILGIPGASCCAGATGNVDCDPGNGVDISDLTALIDHLYVTLSPLCCPEEANVDGQPGIDISDLTALIDYLYISFTPPAACQ